MWSLADASPSRLSELAKELDASGRWTSFLTPHEHQFFETALKANEQTWALFLDGRIPCQLRIASADESSPASIDVDPVALAFRVRYMLWDTQLERLGDAEPAKSSHQPAIDNISGGEKPPLLEQTENSKRNDDEDYDDDDDDEESDESGAQTGGAAVPPVLVVEAKEEDSEPDPRGRQLTVQNCSKMYHTFESDHDTMQRYQRLQASDEQIESQDEGANDPNGNNRASSETSSLAALAKTAQFGSASLSLKHLLGTIESKWSELHVTDIELRNLISDVRKNRSKWASEDRIGQEELYEACEKVVQELRSTTEHSTAFLNKVNKRDAPNYYQIIKNPMDLNTVMRKLRMYQYNSKSEFVDDLNLIWQNCLTYNSDPRHFLRAHAIAMRKKTATLSPLIPDVKIRDRAEVEAEAEEQERLRGLESNDKKRKAGDGEGGKGQKRKLGKAPVTTTNNDDNAGEESGATGDSVGEADGNSEHDDNANNSVLSNDAPASRATSAGPSRAASVPPVPSRTASPAVSISTNHSGASKEGGEAETDHIKSEPEPNGNPDKPNTSNSEDKMDVDGTVPTDGEHQAAGKSEKESNEGGAQDDEESSGDNDKNAEDEGLLTPIEEEYKVPDVETAVWNSASKRRRLECITNRRALFTENKLQMDAPIELRRPGLMARFDNAIKSEDLIGQTAGISLLSVDPGEEPFLVEYEVNAGLPSPPKEDQSSWLTAQLPHPNELPPTNYLSRGTLTDFVNRNLNEMQMIRRLCAKILFIRDLKTGQISDAPAAAQPNMAGQSTQEYPDVHDPEPDISSRLPGAVPFDSKAAYAGMQRATAKLAMHAGFEAAQPVAADVLAEIAGDYLMKLGETLVAQLEAPGSSESFSTIIKSSLSEMGISRLDSLSKYISDDILKQGKRLSTFRSRLNRTLVDILRPEVERYNDEQFNDNSDQFVMGQFSNELGDDYFGFKELGLDQELGVANIAIPFHLLRQRLVTDQSAGITRPGNTSSLLQLGVPEYPPLTLEAAVELPAFLRDSVANVLPKSAGSAVLAAAAAKEEQGDPSVEPTEAEKDERAKVSESQGQVLVKAASQAAAARSKIPASGKLVPRKKNINKAFKRKKPVITENEHPQSSPKSGTDTANVSTDQADPIVDDSAPTDTQPNPADVEVDSLIPAFDENNTDNGFSLDDNITTGSLMMGSGDAEDGDGGDGADNGDGDKMDDLDMSIPSFDF